MPQNARVDGTRADILLVGGDTPLLVSRQLLLQAAGYTVIAVTTSELYALPVEEDIRLTILCHTVPTDERPSVLAWFREHLPYSQILVLNDSSKRRQWPSVGLPHSETAPLELLQNVAASMHVMY